MAGDRFRENRLKRTGCVRPQPSLMGIVGRQKVTLATASPLGAKARDIRLCRRSSKAVFVNP